MEKDLLFETIEVYDRLGIHYADAIADAKLPSLPLFINMLPMKARVLDVGCAAGRDSAILGDAGCEVIGIDLANSLLRLARQRVQGVDFLCMDARNLAFQDNNFDAIWAHAAILNLLRSEIEATLHEFYRVLRPGGVCYIGLKEGVGERYIGEPLVENMKRRETYFQKSEINNLFESAGFEDVVSSPGEDVLGRLDVRWLYNFARKPKAL